jgi:hypothetical protein
MHGWRHSHAGGPVQQTVSNSRSVVVTEQARCRLMRVSGRWPMAMPVIGPLADDATMMGDG